MTAKLKYPRCLQRLAHYLIVRYRESGQSVITALSRHCIIFRKAAIQLKHLLPDMKSLCTLVLPSFQVTFYETLDSLEINFPQIQT